MSTILVTGGAGYIGSHTCVELLNSGYNVVVVDNLSNSCKTSIERVEEITGKKIKFYKGDIADRHLIDIILKENKIFAVIHFAGLKAVGESCAKPLEYYKNNISGTLEMCDVMRDNGVKNIVFSSSATVYGDPATVPITEDFPLSATNPYGRTKLMQEETFHDFYIADKEWNILLLRYFNPIGAHKSGKIGEDPNGIPNNLMPYIAKVATGQLPRVNVFGNDYDTPDGTGVRDYIHVVDLAIGHVKAIKKLEECREIGVKEYNLGTGIGYSVLDVINNFSKACEKQIPYVITDRRPGDIAECYADVTLAKEELEWEAQYGIKEMCEDTWNWQKNNPNGYKEI